MAIRPSANPTAQKVNRLSFHIRALSTLLDTALPSADADISAAYVVPSAAALVFNPFDVTLSAAELALTSLDVVINSLELAPTSPDEIINPLEFIPPCA